MRYRRLGKAGLQVSEVALGLMRFGWDDDPAQRQRRMTDAVAMAVEHGVNHFDGAEGYGRDGGAEAVMGQAIRELGLPRDRLVLSSKAAPHGHPASSLPSQMGLSRKHLVECCDAACRRYGVDYLDMYYCHRPDPEVTLQEVAETMHELVLRGKILYWGTSHFSVDQIETLCDIAASQGLRGPSFEQGSFNAFDRQALSALIPALKRLGLGFCAHSPLCAGVLSGKYDDGLKEALKCFPGPADLARQQIFFRDLAALAGRSGLTTAQLSIATVLRHQEVSTVTVGSTDPRRLAACCQASDLAADLPVEVMHECDALLRAVDLTGV